MQERWVCSLVCGLQAGQWTKCQSVHCLGLIYVWTAWQQPSCSAHWTCKVVTGNSNWTSMTRRKQLSVAPFSLSVSKWRAVTTRASRGTLHSSASTGPSVGNWSSNHLIQLEQLQHEDPDLGILHAWLDEGLKPEVNQVSKHGPAVRFYFLHFVSLDCIGLHLFNDDTRPSGHISHPSQIGFSHRCLHSINGF